MNTDARNFDVIVVGTGGMGSAAAFHLARRGRHVLGLERFALPHEMGSSHGLSRVIRLTYFEHPSYVPLLRRAYELWRELERLSGEDLLTITGSLEVGAPGGAVIEGSLKSAETHDLPHEVLTSAQAMQRFPAYRLPADFVAILQPDGGFLDPERCILAHAGLARASGAEIHTGEAVLGWEPASDGVRVWTQRSSYLAERLVITAGAWASKLIPELVDLAVPERQVIAWFQPRCPELFRRDRFPVFVFDAPEARYYGFPMYGLPGLKVGCFHHLREAVDPDAMDRLAHPEDEEVLRAFVEHYLPDGAGPALALKVCLFTNSPDEHFIIDQHPACPQVIFAAGFSGHGFKFCSVIGEILADLVVSGSTSHDTSLFRMARLR
jgi:sarcosine oxidase